VEKVGLIDVLMGGVGGVEKLGRDNSPLLTRNSSPNSIHKLSCPMSTRKSSG